MKNEIIVKGLEMYASHINSLVDQAMGDKAFVESVNGRMFVKALLFNSGMAEERAHNYDIELKETFSITHEQYVEVLLDHAKTLNEVLQDESIDDSVKMYLTISYETTVEQAKAVSAIAAKEFETLQNIEERGVVEVEPVELYNADSMVKDYKPSNEATKLLNELVNGVRAPLNFS